MLTENEWNTIAKKAFPKKSVKAPPFLWTRLLARIDGEETRRAATWWMQWRWMSRVAVAVGLLVSLGTFYALRPTALSLESALEGRTSQDQALQLASNDAESSDEMVGLVLGINS